MDERFKSAIEKIKKLAEAHPEFGSELRKELEMPPSADPFLANDKLNHIYEYCIEEILKQQAKDFYKDFPLPAIIPSLEQDYVRMEAFRRKDNFFDFCLALYQQIENITNHLINQKPELSDIVAKMWACPAYVKKSTTGEALIYDREDREEWTYQIADLVFMGKSVDKSKKELKEQYAIDKVRTIVYFIGYKAVMTSNDYDGYVRITTLLNDIYLCRNLNHRGNPAAEWSQKTLDRIMSLKSYYYFEFLGALAQFVSFIRGGLPKLPNIKAYADTLKEKEVIPRPEKGKVTPMFSEKKTVPNLKVVGKIDLDSKR